MHQSKRVLAALDAVGARLKRQGKHQVYGLPNGRQVVVASTPSDWRAEENALRQIAHAAGLPKAALDPTPNHRKGDRRRKPGRPHAQWSLPRLPQEAPPPRPTPPPADPRWLALAADVVTQLEVLYASPWGRLGVGAGLLPPLKR